MPIYISFTCHCDLEGGCNDILIVRTTPLNSVIQKPSLMVNPVGQYGKQIQCEIRESFVILATMS